MAHHLVRVVGIIFTLALLLSIPIILLRPAQAGAVVTASGSSSEQPGESAPIYLVIVIGATLPAVWVWAEKMWRFVPS